MEIKSLSLKQLTIILLAVCLCVMGHSQGTPYGFIDGKVSNKVTGSAIGGVTIEIKKNGSAVSSKTSAGNGKFKLELDIDAKYTLVFKSPGFIPRYIEIDLTNIPQEYRYEKGRDIPLDMTLVESPKNVDPAISSIVSKLENMPTSVMKFDKKAEDIAWDMKVTGTYQDELQKLLSKIEQTNKDKEALDKKFKELVAAGDKAAGLSTPDFTTAINSYTEALKIKTDPDVENKLASIKTKQQEFEANKGKEQKYNELITAADKAFASQDYAFAKTQYQEALKIKANEPHPTKRVQEIDKIIASQLEADKKYNEFLAAGNKQLLDKKYDDAIKSFQEAEKIKPKEQEPKDGIAKAKAEKDAAGKLEADYANFIKQGDADFKAAKWDDAISNYESAIKIKNEKYPNDQIALAKQKKDLAKAEEDKKKEEERKQKEYDELIAKADGEMTATEYDKAIASYEAALVIKPKETYPPAQIIKAKKLKKEAEDLAAKKKQEEELQKQYDELIAKADADFGIREWDKSIANYEAALKLKPTEKYPPEQIAKAKAGKTEDAKLAAEKEAEKKKREQYDALITQADADFKASLYPKAITGYEAASKLFSDEPYPKDQIALAKEKMDADKNYAAIITKADADFKAFKYSDAISKYEQAIAIKNETYPNEQIAKAKAELEKLDAEAKKNEKYKELVKNGDDALKATEFDIAITNYEEALKIKTEKYVQDQLAKAKKGKEDAALLAANDQKYNDLVTKADGEFNSSKWDDAIKNYEAALAIKKSEKYPAEQIAKAKVKIAEENAAKLAEAQKEAKYKEVVAKADNEFNAGEFKKAIELYTEALTYKENDKHSTERIALSQQRLKEREDMLNQQYTARLKVADEEFNKGNYKEAIDHYKIASNLKKDDDYPKNKIAEAEEAIKKKQLEDAAYAEKKKKYDAAILKADGEFNTAKYNESIKSYEAAIAIMDEQYPKDQIEKAKAKIEEIANAKEADASYKKFIADADAAFKTADYSTAISNYESALNIKKTEKYPAEQIAKAKALMDTDAKYKDIITKADTEFNSGDYEKCKETYKEALKVKPTEKYPQDQINLANEKLKEITSNEKKKMYDDIIRTADDYFDKTNYAEAKPLYERAKGLNPTDPHPTTRLAEIEKKLKELTDLEAKKRQYDELMKKGDAELNTNNFDKSISTFEAAKIVLPTETLPDEKIAEAKRRKEEYEKMKGAEAIYKEHMTKGMNDYNGTQFESAIGHFEQALAAKPGDKDAEEMLAKAKKEFENAKNFIEEQYRLIVQAADNNFNEKKLKDARDLYTRALKFKPKEVYPQEQIVKIDEMLKNMGTNNAEANSYNALINQANNNFNTENYKKARELYVKASDLKPDQEFPRKRIEEIDRILKELADAKAEKELKEKQQMALNNALNKEDYYGTPVNLSIEEAQKLMVQKNIDDHKLNTEETENTKLSKELREMNYAQNQDAARFDNHTTFIESKEKLTMVGSNGEAIRADNVTEYRNFIEEREIANSNLSHDYNNRIMENHNNFTQQKIELEFALAGQDRTRQEKVEELKAYKEARYETEGNLSGTSDLRLHEKSEQLRADNFQLQDQLAGQDATRQEKVELTANLKEARYQTEEELRGDTDEKLFNTSEKLREDNFQLQDQLAGQDVTRQEKTNDLLAYKEYRYEAEGELSGTSDRRILDKHDDLVAQNFQLQDQLAGQDITRQEKNNDLQAYKEFRYQSEGEFSEGIDQKRFNTSQKLTGDQYQLTDQLAGQDRLRQSNVEEYKTIADNKNSFESNASQSQTSKTYSVNDKFTEQENQIADKQSELASKNNENIEKLKQLDDARNNASKDIAEQNKNKTLENQQKLESQKYQQNDPNAGETAVLVSEKQFQKTDANGKPIEVTIQRMVRKGNTVYEYLMIVNKSGSSCFRNGKPISENQFQVDTNVPKE